MDMINTRNNNAINFLDVFLNIHSINTINPNSAKISAKNSPKAPSIIVIK
ncbi:hypothetical protein HYU06_03375 [Candidatus Woesearchaeota archaeon]|nr:hypothetical protein [Candidatus Woesearchaeota archaeon]